VNARQAALTGIGAPSDCFQGAVHARIEPATTSFKLMGLPFGVRGYREPVHPFSDTPKYPHTFKQR
jgi:hypothetical protein